MYICLGVKKLINHSALVLMLMVHVFLSFNQLKSATLLSPFYSGKFLLHGNPGRRLHSIRLPLIQRLWAPKADVQQMFLIWTDSCNGCSCEALSWRIRSLHQLFKVQVMKRRLYWLSRYRQVAIITLCRCWLTVGGLKATH